MIHHSEKFRRKLIAATLLDQNAVSLVDASKQATVVAEPVSVPPEVLLGKIASAMQRIEQQNNNDDVVALAIALSRVIVEKLIGSSADLQEQRLYRIIQETQFGAENAVGVHLHPNNIGFVSTQLKADPNGSKVNLVPDESIAVGECRVEFKDYDLISSIEQQLDQIEKHIAELNDE